MFIWIIWVGESYYFSKLKGNIFVQYTTGKKESLIFCSPMFHWSFTRLIASKCQQCKKKLLYSFLERHQHQNQVHCNCFSSVYMEDFLIAEAVHVQRGKKNPRYFPDDSPSLPIAVSNFCSLPYILAGILKREKEQKPLKASGAVRLLQILSSCPLIICNTYLWLLIHISRHRENQGINHFYEYCKDQD